MAARIDRNRRRIVTGLAASPLAWLAACQQGGVTTRAAAGGAMPRGLHASLMGDARSSRAITWFTDGPNPPASMLEFDSVEPGMSAAQIQSVPMAMRQSAEASPIYDLDGFAHRAAIDVLDPDKPMRYRVGSDGAWSDVRIIAPTPQQDWSFVHFGDHGTGINSARVTEAILRERFDLLLLAGDLSYANGDQPVWDTWFAQNEDLLSTHVSMAAPGNHEAKDGDGDAFKTRFTHPNPPTSALTGSDPGSSFYSFDYNRVHFLVTTAGALINDGTLPVEIAAIELDLAQAAAARAAGLIDFICVLQHYTIWTDQAGRSPANPTLVALEENIILRYGVDLLLVGHDHVYQRSGRMGLGMPNPLGYVQNLVGTGGVSVRLFDDDGPQSWSEREFIGIGYCKYQVSRDAIRGQFFGAPPEGLSDELRQTVTADFALQDEFTVPRRDAVLARGFAQPPRPAEDLLRDYDAIARHTRDRNRRALTHCA